MLNIFLENIYFSCVRVGVVNGTQDKDRKDRQWNSQKKTFSR